jgi:uncharacterized SAM-binding protein YcdF (DUF218 family)
MNIAVLAVLVILAFDLATVIGFSIIRPTVPAKVDAVIVLGAKVGTPALTGLMYYQEHKTNALVLSGARGPGESVTEAQAMETVIKKQVAKTHGTMPEIILETKSTNTYQNMRNSKALIPKARSVVIVSDDYHLARSVLLAKHLGFQEVYRNAPKPSYYSGIDLVYYYVREVVAIIAYLPKLI